MNSSVTLAWCLEWSGRRDSNSRPPGPDPGALARLRYAPTHLHQTRGDTFGNGLIQLLCTCTLWPNRDVGALMTERAYWESHYQKGETPWDKGEASPGLLDFLQSHPDLMKGSVCIPGCGMGHDVRA